MYRFILLLGLLVYLGPAYAQELKIKLPENISGADLLRIPENRGIIPVFGVQRSYTLNFYHIVNDAAVARSPTRVGAEYEYVGATTNPNHTNFYFNHPFGKSLLCYQVPHDTAQAVKQQVLAYPEGDVISYFFRQNSLVLLSYQKKTNQFIVSDYEPEALSAGTQIFSCAPNSTFKPRFAGRLNYHSAAGLVDPADLRGGNNILDDEQNLYIFYRNKAKQAYYMLTLNYATQQVEELMLAANTAVVESNFYIAEGYLYGVELERDELRVTQRPLANPLSFNTIFTINKHDENRPKFMVRYESNSIFSLSDTREYSAAKLIKKLRSGEGYVFVYPDPHRHEEVQLIVGSYWVQSSGGGMMYGAGGSMVPMGGGASTVNNPYIQFTYNQINQTVSVPMLPYQSTYSRWQEKRKTLKYTENEKVGDERLYNVGNGYLVAYLDKKGNHLVVRKEFSTDDRASFKLN